MTQKLDCPACGSAGYTVFLEIEQAPVHVGVVWETREAALGCARGDIHLAFCRHCGFIDNVAFDDSLVDYNLRYDNALHFSKVFVEYERGVAERLISRYDIREGDVLEIGCGGGHFLGLLCELGDNRGHGYDPSHDPANADASVGKTVEVVKDYYSDEYADQPADLIACRHVLEHIQDPRAFLESLRTTLDAQPDCVLYFEVPNAFLALRDLSIWDVIYEHTIYFVPNALGTLFRATGFEVLDLHEAYDGQFVGIEARPCERPKTPPEPVPTPGLVAEVEAYGAHFRAKRDEWQRRMDAFAAAGRKTVVWGGGAKAVSFLHLLDVAQQVEWVVDINPGKQGSFLAGGGQAIVAPERLVEIQPDVVVVMNPVYKAEIEAQLSQLGLSPEVLTV